MVGIFETWMGTDYAMGRETMIRLAFLAPERAERQTCGITSAAPQPPGSSSNNRAVGWAKKHAVQLS